MCFLKFLCLLKSSLSTIRFSFPRIGSSEQKGEAEHFVSLSQMILYFCFKLCNFYNLLFVFKNGFQKMIILSEWRGWGEDVKFYSVNRGEIILIFYFVF